jgi:aldose 1-epimerase
MLETAGMPNVVTIRSGETLAEILPELGGGLARFDYGGRPIFRPWDGQPGTRLANFILVPWSNRISGGGFTFDGTFHPLAPNRDGEKYPIHGNGFSSIWTVDWVADDVADLSLASTGPGPFRYDTRLRYAVRPEGLEMTLSVTNRADIRLPYGLGFHPFFVRTPATVLTANLPQIWLVDEDHMPVSLVSVDDRPDRDFRPGRPLPQGLINNAFPGWDGQAHVEWPENGLTMDMVASPELSCALIFSPSAESGFFCVEPVSHRVDSFNAPGGAEADGMRILGPGETMTVSCRFNIGLA